jgi:hypothetical protein
MCPDNRCNFSDLEIEMFISQYDDNEDHEIDETEAKRVFRDLTAGKPILGIPENFKLSEKYEQKRVPPPNDADLEKYYF